jgi:hypothetical protein
LPFEETVGLGGGGSRRRMRNCWPTVHRFVVIQ